MKIKRQFEKNLLNLGRNKLKRSRRISKSFCLTVWLCALMDMVTESRNKTSERNKERFILVKKSFNNTTSAGRSVKNIIVILIMSVVIMPLSVYAHGGKEHNKNQHAMIDTFTVANGDTIAVNGKSVKALKEKHVEAEKEEPFVLKPSEEIFEHLHNKMVHFPIALAFAAFLFSLLNIKKQSHCTYQTIKILLGISLFTAIIAYFTGNSQITVFIGDPREWLAKTHRLIGIISTILILIWFVFSLIERTKKHSWVIGLIVVIAISITGFLGGVLAH